MLQPQEHDTAFRRFMTLTDQYERFIMMSGRRPRRARPEQARHLFEALSEQRKEMALARLAFDLSLYEEAVAAGEALTQSPRLLWRFFVKSGLTPCSDIFDKITDTDIVEVFDREGKILFANFKFFEFVGSSLEQIFSCAWYEATRRDPLIEAKMRELMARMRSGEIRRTFDPGIPRHLVEEIDSEQGLKRDLLMKWGSPLYRNGQYDAFVVVLDVQPVCA